MCYLLIIATPCLGTVFLEVYESPTAADSECSAPRLRTNSMIKRHRHSDRQVATDLGSEIHGVREDSERRPIQHESESDPHPNKSPHVDGEMLMIWSFVVFSFAALFAAGYVIWAKCGG
jgi:hypothetical protein